MSFILNVVFRLLSFIPSRLMLWFTYPLGSLTWKLSPTKRTSTQKNLKACYPDLDEGQRDVLGKESMRHYAYTALEMGKAWHWTRSRLLKQFDDLVLRYHGRVYLSKDARLSPATFRKMYPHYPEWLKIKTQIDPQQQFDSALAQRLKIGDPA